MLSYLPSVSPLAWTEIATAVLCGTILGSERQAFGKPAGIRTSILVCLGTYLFVKLGMTTQGDSTDAVRMIGQVITGIGFLGGGVILARHGSITGVTSAAVIWLLAAIGALLGQGYCQTAIIISVLGVAILLGMDYFERIIPVFNKHAQKQSHGDQNPDA